ncbi:hypothetical protein F2Q68_00010016 [Brassica cretica]|uniref:Uncharacterized protein n=1 Tax=Brassica cretica TaxID=69181 RepID=A0A8S9KUH0_BRACR|nr:hypothetical protein F2Q68_00010016 [Brassica cretica]
MATRRPSKSFRGTPQHPRKYHATLDQADPNQTKRSSRFTQIGQTDIIYGKSSTNSTWFDPDLFMEARRSSKPSRRHPKSPQLHQHPGDQVDLSSHQPSIFGSIYTKCFGGVSTIIYSRPTAIFFIKTTQRHIRKTS